jgi:hypothetical protein
MQGFKCCVATDLKKYATSVKAFSVELLKKRAREIFSFQFLGAKHVRFCMEIDHEHT